MSESIEIGKAADRQILKYRAQNTNSFSSLQKMLLNIFFSSLSCMEDHASVWQKS